MLSASRLVFCKHSRMCNAVPLDISLQDWGLVIYSRLYAQNKWTGSSQLFQWIPVEINFQSRWKGSWFFCITKCSQFLCQHLQQDKPWIVLFYSSLNSPKKKSHLSPGHLSPSIWKIYTYRKLIQHTLATRIIVKFSFS